MDVDPNSPLPSVNIVAKDISETERTRRVPAKRR